jgi:hypothetical protein
MEPFNDIILRFSQFLSVGWPVTFETAGMLKQLDTNEFMSDWMQANWEILVEAPCKELLGFDVFLEPYGEGADCNTQSSRVYSPEAVATHRILCTPRKGNRIDDLLTKDSINNPDKAVIFDHFAIKSDTGWHKQAPPFDSVLGYYDGQEVLIQAEQLSFFVEKITDKPA